jgi:DNA repair protein RadC
MLRGAQSLSDAELISILLRTGTKGKNVIQLAQELLIKFGDINVLSAQTLEAIKKLSGIGKDKAATLIAAFEIGRRSDFKRKWASNKSITTPADLAEIFIPILRDEIKEKFYVVCLSTSNKIIKHELISVGHLNANVVHPREVFKAAIENNSAAIILMHNHPSGNPEPSNEDISLTKRLIEAGKIFEIQVLDHIIIAGNNYTSLVEKRLF